MAAADLNSRSRPLRPQRRPEHDSGYRRRPCVSKPAATSWVCGASWVSRAPNTRFEPENAPHTQDAPQTQGESSPHPPASCPYLTADARVKRTFAGAKPPTVHLRRATAAKTIRQQGDGTMIDATRPTDVSEEPVISDGWPRNSKINGETVSCPIRRTRFRL